MKREKSSILISLILVLAINAAIVGVVDGRVLARLYVDPSTNTAQVGESFTVKVNIREVKDLYGFNFYVTWNASVLNVTKVDEGDYLNERGVSDTFFQAKLYNDRGPRGYKGYVAVWNTLLGIRKGVDGSGTLVEIEFLVIADGECALDLHEALLYDSLYGSPGVLPIKHATEDGYFNVSPAPSFQVDPSSIVDPTLLINDTFVVGVNVSEVVDLYGFEFKLGYDTTILNCTEVSVVPFLNEPTSVINNEINRTLGFVWLNIASTAAVPVSGSGAVANVTFQVLDVGECSLDLYDTKLDDALDQAVFEHTPPAEDGYFSNIPVGHDIAVTRLTVFPDEVTAGESISINVTVVNAGGYSETFHVSISYGGTLIEKRFNITLDSGIRETVEFTWDTTGTPAGAYIIKAEASTVSGETDTDDNTRTYTAVRIKAPGSDLLLYAAVGIVVVIAVGITIYFLKVRKPKVT